MPQATRCKCDFPTHDEWRRSRGRIDAETHSRLHRQHHDEWAARQVLDPEMDAGKILAAQSIAVEYEQRISWLEALAVVQGGVMPEDRWTPLHQTYAGQIEARLKEGT